MDPIKIRAKHGPEWRIQARFVRYLEERHWHVERMVGNAYQFGIPDLYVAHRKHGDRWIDIKNPTSYEFTIRQIQTWPVWEAHGVGIWIITCDEDYPKLFEAPNWRDYYKEKYNDIPTREELIDELDSRSRP